MMETLERLVVMMDEEGQVIEHMMDEYMQTNGYGNPRGLSRATAIVLD